MTPASDTALLETIAGARKLLIIHAAVPDNSLFYTASFAIDPGERDWD